MTRNTSIPPHTIDYPRRNRDMADAPQDEMRGYRGRGLLDGRKALITGGGDSGIGRAVAVAFAKEGADVAIAYLEEDRDAEHTAELVRHEGRDCHLFRGGISPIRGGTAGGWLPRRPTGSVACRSW